MIGAMTATNVWPVPQLPRRQGGVSLPGRGVRLRRDARRARRDRRRRRPRRAALAGGRRRDVRHRRPRRQRVLAAADELRLGLRRHRRSPRRLRAGRRRRGEVVREMRDEDYGSTGFSVRDPEDNIWSFGTYRVSDRVRRCERESASERAASNGLRGRGTLRGVTYDSGRCGSGSRSSGRIDVEVGGVVEAAQDPAPAEGDDWEIDALSHPRKANGRRCRRPGRGSRR